MSRVDPAASSQDVPEVQESTLHKTENPVKDESRASSAAPMDPHLTGLGHAFEHMSSPEAMKTGTRVLTVGAALVTKNPKALLSALGQILVDWQDISKGASQIMRGLNEAIASVLGQAPSAVQV